MLELLLTMLACGQLVVASARPCCSDCLNPDILASQIQPCFDNCTSYCPKTSSKSAVETEQWSSTNANKRSTTGANQRSTVLLINIEELCKIWCEQQIGGILCQCKVATLPG